MTNEAPCHKCQSTISIEAVKCPHCGYEPQATAAGRRKAFKVTGWLLTATIVGAPLGIPLLVMVWIADRHHSGRTPTNP